MEPDSQTGPVEMPSEASPRNHGVLRSILSGVIIVFVFAVGYLSYTFISRGANPPPPAVQQGKAQKILQLDVLNGSGARGMAARCTNYLRGRGFDVVEMKNYKLSNIPHTLVIDRAGDRAAARLVAAALGVPDKNVIQQLNPDYFVDVSVIIGADYSSLQPLR